MRFKRLSVGAVLVYALLATACSSMPQEERYDEVFGNTERPRPDTQAAPAGEINGSIYQAGVSQPLFEDNRARRVGDIISIVLVERTQASKNADTTLSRSNDTSLGNPTLFGSPVQIGTQTLEVTAGSEHEFSGSGSSSQSNSLNGSITVTVVRVLPNGNLVVRGQKQLMLNQGSEHIRISGVVRAVDVRSDNTVLSTQVANARIIYGSRGALADANRSGWLSRFFMKIWPF